MQLKFQLDKKPPYYQTQQRTTFRITTRICHYLKAALLSSLGVQQLATDGDNFRKASRSTTFLGHPVPRLRVTLIDQITDTDTTFTATKNMIVLQPIHVVHQPKRQRTLYILLILFILFVKFIRYLHDLFKLVIVIYFY